MWPIGRCIQHLVELEVFKGQIWRLVNSDQGVAKEELWTFGPKSVA